MLRLAIVLALTLGTSAAWAGQACPRMQQHQAYLALLEETGSTAPAETAKVEEPAGADASAVEADELVN
ncbi:MAG: hypothetical protein FJX36_02025 [Alphaproteobacteria bacterium]|nr:hypothetical protein [Alphaproteobacteria bacterium]